MYRTVSQTKRLTLIFVFTILAFTHTSADAEKYGSIIIDDLGNNYKRGQEIIKLPAALTIAILPKTNYAKKLAILAKKNNKEVMLHLPMQSVEHHRYTHGTLDLHMTKNEFEKQLQLNLNSIPHVRGVNNHMGSLLTQHPGHMTWLMDALSKRGSLYFIDSRTTNKSIADKIANEYNIPSLSRDFFLDPDNNSDTLRIQFDRFIKKINTRGYAIAIAHPHPKTIQFLQRHLKELKQHGITLLPVSKLISTAKRAEKKREKNYVACSGSACTRL
ncbi:MAG: divergent polysaccharide deacetylase family protein [Gammaproteobacteria bacterium]|nr:divergent polysaccharide deacetylase family protein [Gammaproteobacteria bacterium]